MSLRAPKYTIESLRLMLQNLEQTPDPAHDPEARAELKRILMMRIANLEAIEALRADAQKTAPKDPVAPKDPSRIAPLLVDPVPQPPSPQAAAKSDDNHPPPAPPEADAA